MESSISHSPRSDSQQFGLNVATNGAMILLNIVVGLLFTPYLINNLGVASYGLVVLAVSLTAYMSIFETAINNAVGRFLTIDIRNGRFDAANQTFNAAFWSGLLLALILLPVVLTFSYLVPMIFDVPVGREQSARVLFSAVTVAYLLIIVRGTFSASAFSYNRLDLQNAIFASNTITRIAIIVLLFVVLAPRAWQVGLGTLAGAGLSLLLAYWIWRLLTPQLSFDRHKIDLSILKTMYSMSGWLLVNQLGTLLFLNIDLIVLNRFLGAEVQGRYGAVLQLSIVLRTLVAAVATAITPIALQQYAQGNLEKLAEITRKSVKWLGLAIAFPIGFIVGFAAPLLKLWLGPEFSNLALLAVYMIAHLSVNLSVRPLFSIQTAMNKVRVPGVVTLVLGASNLVLAVLLVNLGENGIGVAIAGGIVLTLKNTFFTPIYGAHIQELPWYTFLMDMLPGVVAAALVVLVSFVTSRLLITDDWLTLMAISSVIGLTYFAIVYAFVLSNEDRIFLRQLIEKRKKVT